MNTIQRSTGARNVVPVVLLLTVPLTARTTAWGSSLPPKFLIQRDRDAIVPTRTLPATEAAVNLARFQRTWPTLWGISRELIAELKHFGLANIVDDKVMGTLHSPFLRPLREDSTWGEHLERDGEKYAVRVTLIPLGRDGKGMPQEIALHHVASYYQTDTTFYNEPTFIADTLAATKDGESLVIYYEQRIGRYYFLTQEHFRTSDADFECIFWPRDTDPRGSYGVDIVLLIPSADSSVSHVLFITVYTDPKRPKYEDDDTKNQHEKILSVLRRVQ